MQLQLRPHEKILFLGDSITEENLWTLFVETELLIRYPEYRLRFRNRGWAGNRAEDGLARFDRDVAPSKPTWVWIAFGMNDGGYGPLSQRRLQAYTTALQGLIAKVEGIGARPLLLGPTAAGGRHSAYNETLAHFREAAHGVAEAAGAPFIDLLPVLLGRDDLLPDDLHPTEEGHRLIARSILDALELPPAPVWRGDLGQARLLSGGVLPHVPGGVLPSAPTSGVDLLPSPPTWTVFRDGERIASVTAAQAAAGVPLLRFGPLLALGRTRWQHDRAAWRVYGALGPEGQRHPTLAQIAALQAVDAERERWILLEKLLGAPLTLQSEEVLDLNGWELCGPFPIGDQDPATFEAEPRDWKALTALGGHLDLQGMLGPIEHAIAYLRTTVDVTHPGELRLALGSGEGYQARLDGELIGAHPGYRATLRGEDRLARWIEPGRHELRLRLHHETGGWAFFADGWLSSGEPVTLPAPHTAHVVVAGGYVAAAAMGTATSPGPVAALTPLPAVLERRAVQPEDEGALLDLWNRSFPTSFPLRAALLRHATWLSPLFDQEGSQTVWDRDRLVAALFLKRFIVPMHAVPADGRGFISALFVDPDYQGRGIGTALLKDAIAHVRRYSQDLIRLGGDPDRLLPGIPWECGPAITWFARRGATLAKPAIDLQNLDLQGTDLTYGEPYRPATLEDRADLLAFLAMDFPGRWTWEVERHFENGGRPEDLMLAERNGRIVGFACIYDPESPRVGPGTYWTLGRDGDSLPPERRPGGLGPIGVGLSVRGKGMGLGLLQAGLAELQQRGVTEAVIDWTSLVPFYGKVGFRPWRYYTMAHFE